MESLLPGCLIYIYILLLTQNGEVSKEVQTPDIDHPED